jgi:hypothetical protein
MGRFRRFIGTLHVTQAGWVLPALPCLAVLALVGSHSVQAPAFVACAVIVALGASDAVSGAPFGHVTRPRRSAVVARHRLAQIR